MPLDPPGLSPGALAEEEARTRGGVDANGLPQVVPAPDRDKLSRGAKGVLDWEHKAEELTNGRYQDPEAARAKLRGLDEAGQDRLRADATEIGPLRRGVDVSQEDREKLATLGYSHESVTVQDQREANGYTRQHEAHDNSLQARDAALRAKSPEAQMNNMLGGAPMSIQSISI